MFAARAPDDVFAEIGLAPKKLTRHGQGDLWPRSFLSPPLPGNPCILVAGMNPNAPKRR